MHILLASRIGKWTHGSGAASGHPGRVLPWAGARACNDGRGKRDSERCASSRRASCFRSALRRSTRKSATSAAGRAPGTLALVSAALSSSAAGAVSRCGQCDANPAAGNKDLLHKTCSNRWDRARFRSHRRRELKRLASTMARRLACRTRYKLPACYSRVVEPAIYTVRGRQAGDLRRKLRYRADSQGKTRRAIVWKAVPFLAGPPTRRVRRREGGESCVVSWSSMTTCIPALPWAFGSNKCGFRVAITEGGESVLAALSDAAFDLMIVDVFMRS